MTPKIAAPELIRPQAPKGDHFEPAPRLDIGEVRNDTPSVVYLIEIDDKTRICWHGIHEEWTLQAWQEAKSMQLSESGVWRPVKGGGWHPQPIFPGMSPVVSAEFGDHGAKKPDQRLIDYVNRCRRRGESASSPAERAQIVRQASEKAATTAHASSTVSSAKVHETARAELLDALLTLKRSSAVVQCNRQIRRRPGRR